MFSELLAYSMKPTFNPTVLFSVNVELPQSGIELNDAQVVFTQ